MDKLLPIVTAPNPILYQKTQTVKNFGKELQDLVEKMIPTMRAKDGIGLAATQVGAKQRVAVVEFVPREGEEGIAPVPLTVLVNPKIISHSTETTVAEEGCLSLPDINLRVPRHRRVKVLYWDINGKRHKIKATDLFARALQHEIDHLDGILITDRALETKEHKTTQE